METDCPCTKRPIPCTTIVLALIDIADALFGWING
jgi:hypothetical protein